MRCSTFASGLLGLLILASAAPWAGGAEESLEAHRAVGADDRRREDAVVGEEAEVR